MLINSLLDNVDSNRPPYLLRFRLRFLRLNFRAKVPRETENFLRPPAFSLQ